MNFAYSFNVSAHSLILLLVLYIFGACMLLMAVLIHQPLRWLAFLSIAIIALHNMLDPYSASRFGRFGWAWHLLHQPGVIMLGNRPAIVVYPILPWIGVMTAGFCFAQIFTLADSTRRRISFRLGLALIAVFLVLRVINIYGDPSHWTRQKSILFTALSFLNCTKYPASLDYILMTIGPALLMLAWYDRLIFSNRNPPIVFGRVPLFYFVLHFYAIHILLVIMSYIRYSSRTFSFIFNAMRRYGWPQRSLSSRFRLPSLGHVCCLDRFGCSALPTLPLVRAIQSDSPLMVVELSLDRGIDLSRRRQHQSFRRGWKKTVNLRS
jgi:uncharacterized membrane protein